MRAADTRSVPSACVRSRIAEISAAPNRSRVLAGDQKHMGVHVFDPNGTPITNIPARSASRDAFRIGNNGLVGDDRNACQPGAETPLTVPRTNRRPSQIAGLDRRRLHLARPRRQERQCGRFHAARQPEPTFDPPSAASTANMRFPANSACPISKASLPANIRNQIQCLPVLLGSVDPTECSSGRPSFWSHLVRSDKTNPVLQNGANAREQMIVSTTISTDDLRQRFYRQKIGTEAT